MFSRRTRFLFSTAALTLAAALYAPATAHALCVGFVPNGVLETGEECDDGNSLFNDGCSRECTVESWVCGDGVVEGTETCDDGNAADGDGCSAHCEDEHLLSICGDGIVSGAEQCDDGNAVDGDGCSDICFLEYCGNFVRDPGEDCDPFIPSACCVDCECPRCGDGAVNTLASCGFLPVCPGIFVEACDDGNTVSGDGCDSACEVEFCGDGIVQALLGENCDDGNVADGDGCSSACVLETTASCGNGVVEPGEICDDVITGCCIDCGCPRCGDGVLTATPCSAAVQLSCVDFVPEQCDDGNNADGDGCSRICRVETQPVECCVDQDGDGWPTVDAVLDPAVCLSGPISGSHTQYVPCGTGGALVAEDCEDSDSAIHPGATEIPGNAVDENCNGFISCGAAEGANPAWGSVAAVPAVLGFAWFAVRRRLRRG